MPNVITREDGQIDYDDGFNEAVEDEEAAEKLNARLKSQPVITADLTDAAKLAGAYIATVWATGINCKVQFADSQLLYVGVWRKTSPEGVVADCWFFEANGEVVDAPCRPGDFPADLCQYLTDYLEKD